MDLFFVAAAVLLVLSGVIHSALGEKKLITPLRQQINNSVFQEDPLNRAVLRVAWHLTTIAWWGAAVVVLDLANLDDPPSLTVHAMATTFVITGLGIGLFTHGKHPGLILFLSIAGCLWAGL